MTPADRAMKNALDEGVRQARSPPRMAPAALPLRAREPEHNLTSSDPQTSQLPSAVDQSLGIPVPPHLTLHQFRQLQHSPSLSSTPDIDYKRVRRKASSSNLTSGRRNFDSWPLPTTPLSPLFYPISPQSPSFTFPPPSPPTPQLPPSATSPSLSSTVDTLSSTPLHTPTPHGGSSFDQWRNLERFELSEPIRSKRKFPLLKTAKRLPHYTALDQGGGGIWEVHAAVIDLGAVDLAESRGPRHEEEVHMIRAENETPRTERRPTGRKGLSVRFEDTTAATSKTRQPSPISQNPPPAQEEDRSWTSSYTLSKFRFPAPPGYHWTGTFGHLNDLTPPTSSSPTTLHYRGASFDVVNPHASLLLGHPDFETPAEIDGLLDDYFNRSSHSLVMPYNDETGERSGSQHSLPTSTDSARQRRLYYDDMESARRNIMNLPAASSQQTVIHVPRTETPPTPLTGENRAWPPAAISRDPLSAGVQLHPALTEALRGDAISQAVQRAAQQPQATEERFDQIYVAAEHSGLGDDLVNNDARVADRGSTGYPRSQYSNPFDLEVSDYGDGNIAGHVGAGRESFHAGYEPSHDYQAEPANDEDGANTYSTQSSLGQDTTVGKFINRYDYPRSEGDNPVENATSTPDFDTGSSSIEAGRGQPGSRNPFLTLQERARLVDQERRRLDQHTARSRLGDPPNVPPPTPRVQARHAGPGPYYDSELQTSDQTYTLTDELLQQHRREASTETRWPSFRDDSDERELQMRGPTGFRSAFARPGSPGFSGIVYGAHDKENVSPPSVASTTSTESLGRNTHSFSDARSHPMRQDQVAHRGIPRSSSIYPTEDDEGHQELVDEDDNDDWRTEATASHPNLYQARRAEDERQLGRPSQESYANTSISGSMNRLSMPTQEPVPDIPHWCNADRGQPGPTGEMDAQEVRRILAAEIREKIQLGQASAGLPRRSKTQSQRDMRRLEHVRQHNPSAIEQAVGVYGQALENAPSQQVKTSQSSLWKSAKRVLGRSRVNCASASDTQGLLEESAARHYASRTRQLQYSPTANTFQTMRPPPHPFGLHSEDPNPPQSPITPPVNAYVRDRADTASTYATARYERTVSPYLGAIELQPLRRPKQPSRAGITGQRQLRPLTLGAPSASASGNHGRFTDAQLAQAEPSWTNRPRTTGDDIRTTTLALGTPTTEGFGIRQADGTIEHVSLLMSAEQGRTIGYRRRQMQLTRPYLWWCGVFPVTAFMFGLGSFDFRMRQATRGAIAEMAPEAKKEALTVWLPLSTMAWVMLGLVVAMLVIALTR